MVLVAGQDKLSVQLGVDTPGLASSLSRFEKQTADTMERVRRRAGITEKAIGGVGRAFDRPLQPYRLIAAGRSFDHVNSRAGLLRGSLLATTAAFGGFTAALSTNILARYADSFTQINNQIRPLTKSGSELEARFAGIAEVANRSRAGLRETATLYSRIGKASPRLAPERLLRITQTIQKALQLGGATTQEAGSAAIQFSQGLASNRLQGEELRTLLETPLGSALAEGLGVGIGKLREMAAAGELTTALVLRGLLKIEKNIDTQFAKSVQTLDQYILQADNHFIEFVGTLNDTYGATNLVGKAILALAENLDLIAPILGSIGLAAGLAFGGRGLGRLADFSVGRPLRGFQSIRQQAKTTFNDTARDFIADSNKQGVAASARRNLTLYGAAAKERDFGDPRAVAAIKRNALKVEGLETKSVKLLEAEAAARQKLAEVSAASSSRVVNATNAIAKAEANLVDKRKEVERTEKFLRFSPSATEAQKLRAKAGIAALQIENDLVKKRAALATVTDAADKVAAANRLAALKTLQAAENAVIANRSALAAATGETPGLIKARDVAVVTNYAAAVRDADNAVGNASAKVMASIAALEAARKAATGNSLAWQGLKTAGAGLLGFVGGPIGAAFIGLAAAMTYSTIQSQAAAQRMAKADGILRDLGITGSDAAGGVDDLGDKLRGLGDAKILEDIDTLKARLDDLRGSTAGGLANDPDTIAGLIQKGRFGPGGLKSLAPAALFNSAIGNATLEEDAFFEIGKFLAAFDKGEKSLFELNVKLDEIAKKDISDGVKQFALEVARAAKEAQRALDGIRIKEFSRTPTGRKQDADLRFREAEDNSMRELERLNKETENVQKIIQSNDARSDHEKLVIEEMAKLREAIRDKNLGEFVSEKDLRRMAEENVSAASGAKAGRGAVEMIKQFEGFRSGAYFDVSAYRAGYGSDTVTNQAGDVSKVTKNSVVSRADAERDLARRTAEFQKTIIDQIGRDTFDALGESAQAGLTSLAYNYGSLPKNVAAAAKTGDRQAIAEAIIARGSDNGGINAKRRRIEAEAVVSDAPVAKQALDDAEKKKEDAAEKAKKLAELTREQERRTETIKRETEAIGLNVYEKTKAEAVERLRREQQDNEIELTAAVTAKINEQAEAEAKAAAAKASSEFSEEETKKSQRRIEDLKLEAESLGQTTGQIEAKRLALEELRAQEDAGIPISAERRAEILAETEALGQQRDALEALQLTQERTAELNSTFKDATKGFVQDLIAGKSATEALSGALAKLGDKLLDIGFDMLFNATGIFGNKQGGGGLGGLIAGLFGFAQGGVMTGKGPMPLKRYARGGVASSPQMAIYGEGSQNEAFVPLPDGRRIPVALRMPNIPNPESYARPRQTMNRTVNVHTTYEISGAVGDEGMRRIAAQAAVQSAAQIKASLPGWMQEHQELQ